MQKAKATLNIEIDQEKLSPTWLSELENYMASVLDNTMVHFGTDSKAIIKIKDVKLVEVKNDEKK